MAESMLDELRTQVNALKQGGVTPTLAVIQVGDDPGSSAYIRQKQKAAEHLGATLIHSHQSSAISRQQLETTIKKYSADTSVHGIILQRPLPGTLERAGASLANIDLSKDIDGFLPNSPYPVPVAQAVLTILRFVFSQSDPLDPLDTFDAWLKKKQIVILGRGETAGKPIAEALIKKGCNVTVVHSQTPNPNEIITSGDIVLSCVGKPNVVRRDNIKKGAILTSVGLWRDESRKLHGDYEEEEIKDIASFYTPTPGGVGPVNVAALMTNLVHAAESKLL